MRRRLGRDRPPGALPTACLKRRRPKRHTPTPFAIAPPRPSCDHHRLRLVETARRHDARLARASGVGDCGRAGVAEPNVRDACHLRGRGPSYWRWRRWRRIGDLAAAMRKSVYRANCCDMSGIGEVRLHKLCCYDRSIRTRSWRRCVRRGGGRIWGHSPCLSLAPTHWPPPLMASHPSVVLGRLTRRARSNTPRGCVTHN
jgi:hypothetical protein